MFYPRMRFKGPIERPSEDIRKLKYVKGVKGGKPKNLPKQSNEEIIPKSQKPSSPFLINKPSR
jgi:hypothetical protein